MSGLPITHGSLLAFPEDPVACMRRLHAEHGDIAALEDGGQRLFFVFSPEHNKTVLSDSHGFHSRFFAVRGGRRSAQRRVTDGLLSMNEDEHKEHRRMLMGPFQRKALPTYHRVICDLTHGLLEQWQAGETLDMNAEMTRFMLRLTSGLLFGVDNADFAHKIGAMIDRWVHMNHATGMGAMVSDSGILDNYDALLRLAEDLEHDVREMIELRRASDSPPGDVLSLLIQAWERDQRITDEKLTGHVTLLFGAAHLTTAHTLTWTLFLLAQHPEIMRRVTSELDEHVAGDEPTPAEIAGLDTLDRALRESMRVLPASAYSQRFNPRPLALGPFHLPAGSVVIFSQYITHHRSDLYAAPHQFQPDRWRNLTPTAYEYLPFGAGPRMCIGAPLAMMELKTALAMILKRYRLSVAPGARVDGRVISTMLSPTSTLPMLVAEPGEPGAAQPVSGSIHQLVELPDECHAEPGLRRAA